MLCLALGRLCKTTTWEQPRMCCRATVKSKEKELEAQRSRAEQQEKQEARAAQEREALDQQQVKAEDAAHRQVGPGWRADASLLTHASAPAADLLSQPASDVTM